MKQNILFYAEITSTQDFNTGIQLVTRNLSLFLSKTFNIFLVKYDINNELILLNIEETNLFSKYNGYNQYSKIDFYKKTTIFDKIKNDENNIFFMAELLFLDQYNKFENIINNIKSKKIRSYAIYYDDSEYHYYYKNIHTDLNLFDRYIHNMNLFDYIIPISEFSKSTYLFHNNRLQINSQQIIYQVLLPGEIINYSKQIPNSNFDNYIFANCSFIPRKNLIILINAFLLINKIHPQIKLIIAGSKYDSNEYYKSIEPILNKNIVIMCDVSDKTLIELYTNCMFSVYPSLMEGFGLPIYYSIWNGRPVICHNQTSTKEISDNINCRWVADVDCSNIDLLYNKINEFINLLFNRKIIPHSIYDIEIKTWINYAYEITNILYNNKIFICNEILINECYKNRGVGMFGEEIINKYKKQNIVTHNISEINDCHSIVFTHPPPIKNNMNKNEENIMNLLKYISANQKNKIKIVIIFDLVPHIFRDFYKPEEAYYDFFNIIKNDFHLIIAISYSTKNDLINYFGFDEDRIIIYYPSIPKKILFYNGDDETIYSKYNITKKKYIIAPLGNDFRKNIINCIDAFIFLKNENIKLVFMFSIDDETFNYYNNYIYKKTNIINYSNIIFTRYVSDNDYVTLMKNGLVTLFPSLYEGFGYCITESVYLGVPVIASNNSSMGELANISNGSVIACDPYDINDISIKLIYFINSSNHFEINKDLLENIEKNNNVINYTFYSNLNFNNYLKYSFENLSISIQKKIKLYYKKLDESSYVKLLNTCDINFVIHNLTTPRVIIESIHLNKWIITTGDMLIKNNVHKYDKCFISQSFLNNHWISEEYIPNEIDEIVDKIIENYDNIKINEGIDIDNTFNWLQYISTYQDLSHFTNETQAIHHWIHYGKNEGRKPNFNWLQYISKYQDLSHFTNETQAIHHWIHYGKNEGREFTFNKKLTLLLINDFSDLDYINYAIKIMETLNYKNIDTNLCIVYNDNL